MQPWKTRRRETVFAPGDGKFLTVERHEVELPDGQVIDDWHWVITPDFINVVVETAEGRYLCFHQFKYGAGDITLALVGGYLEPGEDPLDAAKRELLEEAGYAAPEWIELGAYTVDGNRGSGTANFYLARGAHWVQPVDADDLEEQEPILLTRAELAQALARGEFTILPWAMNVALALLHMNGNMSGAPGDPVRSTP